MEFDPFRNEGLRYGLALLEAGISVELDRYAGNFIQGGFVTGWIDSCMALAAMGHANFERVAMSLDIRVAIYRSANPGIVVAEGWVERMGGRTCFAEGLLRTQEGKIIAKAMSAISMIPFKSSLDES